MNDDFINVEKTEDDFPTLEQKLEQVWDEYADELGYEREGDYVFRSKYDRNFRAKLTEEKKKEIYRTDSKHFRRIHLDWEEI